MISYIIVGVLLVIAVIALFVTMFRSAPPEFKGRNREFKSLLEKTARPSKRKP